MTFPLKVSSETDYLTRTLVSVYDPSITLGVFYAHNVRWVIVYSGFSRSLASKIHDLGMRCLVYVSALKEPVSAKSGIWNGYTTVIPQEIWAQYDPTSGKYMYPSLDGLQELWFSPYGPYLDQVAIPRIRWNLEQGADGIFLDTLILHPNADDNPTYAHPVWMSRYPTYTYQQFRYRSLHDAGKRIYDALKAANANAILMVSDNNVCVQSPENEKLCREKFASAIDQWEDIADGFVLEYVGLIENNYVSNPLAEAQAIINVWNREKSIYGVTRPMWLIGYTNSDNIFQFLAQKSVDLGFGYWAYNFYFPQRTATITISTTGLGTSPATITFNRPFGNAITVQVNSQNPVWTGHVAKGANVAIATTVYVSNAERFVTKDTHSWTALLDQTFTVNYRHEYYLTMILDVPGGGSLTPGSGWVEAGTVVTIRASPEADFQSWTGIGTGSYTGTANPAQIVMNAPITQIANFRPVMFVTMTSTTFSTTSSTSTMYGSTTITRTQQSLTTTTETASSKGHQTTTAISTGSLPTFYTIRTTLSLTSTSFSTTTSTSVGNTSYTATEISKTQATTAISTSTSATTVTMTGHTTTRQRVDSTMLIQVTSVEQFLQKVLSTVLHLFTQVTKIIQKVHLSEVLVDAIVKVELPASTTTSATITSTLSNSTTSTTYFTSTVATSMQPLSTTTSKSTTTTISMTTTTGVTSGLVSSTYTLRTTAHSTSTSVSTDKSLSRISNCTTSQLSKVGTSTLRTILTSTSTSENTVFETVVVYLVHVEGLIQKIGTLVTQGGQLIVQVVENVIIKEIIRETVVKVDPSAQKSFIKFSLDRRIVGSKGGTIRIVLQVQDSVSIGSYEVRVTAPSEMLVGTYMGTGLFANSKYLPQGMEHRWSNPSVSGRSSGVLTVDLIVPPNLPDRTAYSIILQAVDLKDMSENRIGVSPSPAINLTVHSIHPVTIGMVFEALMAHFRGDPWRMIDRVPTLRDVLDLISIFLAER